VPEPIEIATFDCYGTLVDWEGGFGSYLYAKALAAGAHELVPGRELRERFEAIQFELIQGDYRPYREILAETLRRLCEERGFPHDPAADDAAIVNAMRSFQPFPDTRPALRRTRAAGIRLMIVSNTDRDIIEHTLRQLEVPFDDVQVAEDVGAYKPSDAVFTAALERIGVAPERVLHVAFGFKYDIGPATRVGMNTAWINRHDEPPPGGAPYDHEWRDLWGLANFAETRDD
jgi:2-haloalkanoic acid dehalogenase type II